MNAPDAVLAAVNLSIDAAQAADPDGDFIGALVGSKMVIDGLPWFIRSRAHSTEPGKLELVLECTAVVTITRADPSPQWVKDQRPFSGVIG